VAAPQAASHRAIASGVDSNEKRGPEFAMPEIKKAAEKLPQTEKNRTLS